MTDTDEIARLRALWCEEKSKSMTFYAEVERLRAEVAALTTANASLAGDAVGLRIACASIKAERNEARREACELLARSMKGPMEIAADRGWDCFDAKERER
jgi:uncharacterized protein (DUF58 family)